MAASGSELVTLSQVKTANQDVYSQLNSQITNLSKEIETLTQRVTNLSNWADSVGLSITPNTAILNYNAYIGSPIALCGIVLLRFGIILSKGTNFSSSNLKLGSVPTEYAPAQNMTFYRAGKCYRYSDSATQVDDLVTVSINTSGNITADMSGRQSVGCILVDTVFYKYQ